MAGTTYVLGHKNPDTDAVTAAIGYAALLRLQGQAEAVAARQGPLRRETAYLLDRFGVAPPPLVTDVRPRVADVMTAPAVTVHEDTSLYEVGRILQEAGRRALPVVDDAGRLCGVTGVESFAEAFVGGLDLDQLDHVYLELDNVLRTLGGTVLVAAPERTLRDRVMVGAMDISSMLGRIETDILLVMGDRADAQRAAIEAGVGALVITGDSPVGEEIVALARARGVTLITVPHHTYTTVRLIHLSTPVRHVMRRDAPTCRPDDFVDEVRDMLRSGGMRSLVVVDDAEKVVGLISRTNLLQEVRARVVLVDHNERGQAVAGIEEADVVGVIDHHRVADFQTRTPPLMRVEPVGATSTIVGKLFLEEGHAVPRPVAGVLLGGILADTLIFRGPTTTAEDRRVAALLAERAGVDPVELGGALLRLASDVSDRSAEQLLRGDWKEFTVEGQRFGIGVIETTNRASVLARRDELLEAMARVQATEYSSVLFAVVDIVAETTRLLVVGYEEDAAETFGGTRVDAHTIDLPGIVSRKKHLVPQLGALVRRIEGQ